MKSRYIFSVHAVASRASVLRNGPLSTFFVREHVSPILETLSPSTLPSKKPRTARTHAQLRPKLLPNTLEPDNLLKRLLRVLKSPVFFFPHFIVEFHFLHQHALIHTKVLKTRFPKFCYGYTPFMPSRFRPEKQNRLLVPTVGLFLSLVGIAPFIDHAQLTTSCVRPRMNFIRRPLLYTCIPEGAHPHQGKPATFTPPLLGENCNH